MANNFLNLGMLSVLLVSGLAPSVHSADSDPFATSNATGPSGPMPEMRRAPVPLVRKVPLTSRVPIAVVKPAAQSLPPAVEPSSGSEPAEPAARDQFDSKAAKAAVEADGYKRATVLCKGPNGSWRAKGFRGATEVLLTVDDAGRVSMD